MPPRPLCVLLLSLVLSACQPDAPPPTTVAPASGQAAPTSCLATLTSTPLTTPSASLYAQDFAATPLDAAGLRCIAEVWGATRFASPESRDANYAAVQAVHGGDTDLHWANVPHERVQLLRIAQAPQPRPGCCASIPARRSRAVATTFFSRAMRRASCAIRCSSASKHPLSPQCGFAQSDTIHRARERRSRAADRSRLQRGVPHRRQRPYLSRPQRCDDGARSGRGHQFRRRQRRERRRRQLQRQLDRDGRGRARRCGSDPPTAVLRLRRRRRIRAAREAARRQPRDVRRRPHRGRRTPYYTYCGPTRPARTRKRSISSRASRLEPPQAIGGELGRPTGKPTAAMSRSRSACATRSCAKAAT